MKKFLLLTFLANLLALSLFSQAKIGPAQQKMLDSLCNCMSHLDYSKITTAKEAHNAFMDCFTKHADLLQDVATEEGTDITDDAKMNVIGETIGKNLLKQNCGSFLKLATLMAKDKNNDEETPEIKSTSGTFKRIDNKGFNYIVLNENGSEKSFIWLHQFPDSEKFMNGATGLTGKKLKISWQSTEVYLPQAKGYYEVKEITGIEIL